MYKKLNKSKPTTDPTYDIYRSEHQPLAALFKPQNVAVIGATDREGSVGRTVFWNLISNPFGGLVLPINTNPKRSSVLGVRSYQSIKDTPEAVDLAVIIVPAKFVPNVIKECVDVDVKGAIIISAGFKEIGKEGIELENEIKNIISKSELRIIGPNCLGVMNPCYGLNATFASTMAKPGNVGFISQSGAMCTAVLDWSLTDNVGFSAFISIGSMMDVNWGDLIYYLGDDHHTHSIVIYMESVACAREFLSAAREVALTKPIIIIKGGRSDDAAKAAASHTGSLMGNDEVLDAAFKRSGILRVNTISQLFDMAEVLSKGVKKLPRGPNLTVITNAGGPGVLATDSLVTGGGKLTILTEETIEKLDKILPSAWSKGNPIDILGDADFKRYGETLKIASEDPNSDGLLVILTPQAMTDATKTAEALKNIAQSINKPVLASWMGGLNVKEGIALLNEAKIPTYDFPDAAATVFNYMWLYKKNLSNLYETPLLLKNNNQNNINKKKIVDDIINDARDQGRSILTELESKQILNAYNLPCVESLMATSMEEAVSKANMIGYPVVIKLVSQKLTHKTDVGGVKLNINTDQEVKDAYNEIRAKIIEKYDKTLFDGVTVQPMIDLTAGIEIILGSHVDDQFGPVILFGAGGSLVEIINDKSISLPPLNSNLARLAMEETKIFKALKGIRGKESADIELLGSIMVKFSELILEHRYIKELDMNPVLVCEKHSKYPVIILDARIVLYEKSHLIEDVPESAIKSYPTKYMSEFILNNNQKLLIRPIRPEDETLMQEFHRALSEQSIYFRYFHAYKLSARIAHERLTRICFIDYGREMALVAEKENNDSLPEIIGVGRLSKSHNKKEGEFSMTITDKYQKQGLGTEFLRQILEIAKEDGLLNVQAHILPDNKIMQHICQKLGFEIQKNPEWDYVFAIKKIA